MEAGRESPPGVRPGGDGLLINRVQSYTDVFDPERFKTDPILARFLIVFYLIYIG